ncbi:MAG: response regulator, partial [Verrucomicrobiota bacterium]|nr:response regulator [Verrucomicrobiota bacterium]
MKPAKDFSPNGKVSAGGNQVNILLVDDREDKLQAMEAVLTELNQNLVKARSGKEALRHLLHTDFAVILLDVTMPGMDGFETATFIRQRLKSEHTPIIFVTSHSDSENHIAKGYSLGAVDYMMTPIVSEVLKTKVSVFVELYKKTEQIKQQAERLRHLGEIEH